MSRARRPKQFLALAGDQRLIEATWDRAARLVPRDRIWAVAPAQLARAVTRALPGLAARHLVVEPSPRDTAPAIGLACAAVARRDPEAIVAVLPTDHVVRDVPAFARAVALAAREAERDSLVCLGVRPDRPSTGFGYLEVRGRARRGGAQEVVRFVEKPDAARARRFVRSGRFLWNGGMFVWRASRFLDELARAAPAIRAAAERTARGDRRAWSRAPRISVDYAVMERARGVRVVPLDAGWDDVGSWDAAARLREDARETASRHVLVDSPATVVFDDVGTTAVVGVPGVVVVRTKDALLVVARGRGEEVKRVVSLLRERGAEDLL